MSDRKFQDPMGLNKDTSKFKKREELNISNPTFEPRKFLSSVQKKQVFDDLVKGEDKLKRKIERRGKSMYGLVYDNLGNFLTAHDEIFRVHENLKRGNSFRINSNELEKTLKHVCKESEDLFLGIIRKKNETEKIQKALKILEKYQQIFFMPSVINKCVIEKDYKKLIYVYNRAKYFQNRLNKIKMFEQIFEKIEINISTLRSRFLTNLEGSIKNINVQEKIKEEMLKQKESASSSSSRSRKKKEGSPVGGGKPVDEMMFRITSSATGMSSENSPSSSSVRTYSSFFQKFDKLFLSDRNEKYIVYLYNLDQISEDPALFFLKKYSMKILECLEEIKEKNKVLKQHNKLTMKIMNDGDRGMKRKKRKRNYLRGKKSSSRGTYEGKNRMIILNFIQELSYVLKICLPDYIRLCQNIIQKKYDSKNQEDNGINEENDVLDEIITRYFHLVTRRGIEEIDNGQSHQPVLHLLIEIINECYNTLYRYLIERLSNPEKYYFLFNSYTERVRTIRRSYIKKVWSRTIEETRRFHIKFEENPNANIPLLFFNHIKLSIFQTSKFLTNNSDVEFMKEIYVMFLDCINSMSDVFHELIVKNVLDAKILRILLGHVTIMKKKIVPNLIEYFKNEDFFKFSSIVMNKELMKKEKEYKLFYNTLISIIINYYIHTKNLLMIRYVEKGILLSGYNWENAQMPDGIREFVLEMFLELSLVFSDLEGLNRYKDPNDNELVSESIVKEEKPSSLIKNPGGGDVKLIQKRVFKVLSRRLSEILMEYITQIEKISPNAAFQVDIEVSFIQKCLKRYESEDTRNMYDRLIRHMKEVAGYNPNSGTIKQLKEKLIHEITSRSKFQLSCFYKLN